MNEGPSSSKRPEKLTKGGRGSYCCIPNCGSATYNTNREKTGIALFTFPKDPKRRQTWKRVVNLYRKKGANDNFKITNNTRICEFHFKPEHIKVSLGYNRKKYTDDAVPVIKSLKLKSATIRKPPLRRSPKKHPSSETLSSLNLNLMNLLLSHLN